MILNFVIVVGPKVTTRRGVIWPRFFIARWKRERAKRERERGAGA
jgi:hypothetical protein